jgi:hypothetical protein
MVMKKKESIPPHAEPTPWRPHLTRDVILLWLAWATLMSSYQFWVARRIDLTRADSVLTWTASDMNPDFLAGMQYLTEPILNEHAAWDSEYYLSIAMAGYDDPEIRGVSSSAGNRYQFICLLGTIPDCTSLNYAFFPLYPFLIRILATTLTWLPMSATARFTLVGVLISLIGTLAAMLSLQKLVDERDGMRSAYYLVIFPGSLFLAQVYTEGLFLGLTFATLACLHKRKWLPVALLAGLAVWARPGGALLLLPMVTIWVLDHPWTRGWERATWTGLAALSPLLSYLAWSLTSLASKFHLVESRFFGRGFLDIPGSIQAWNKALQSFSQANLQRVFYYGIEVIAVVLAVVTCLMLVRKRPEIAFYGLAVITFSVLSGSAQGMVRYVSAVPALFMILARWGRYPVFDRI